MTELYILENLILHKFKNKPFNVILESRGFNS